MLLSLDADVVEAGGVAVLRDVGRVELGEGRASPPPGGASAFPDVERPNPAEPRRSRLAARLQ